MTTQSLKQYNIELLRLIQRYSTNNQLQDLSIKLEQHAHKLIIQNKDFSQAKACFTARSVKGGK